MKDTLKRYCIGAFIILVVGVIFYNYLFIQEYKSSYRYNGLYTTGTIKEIKGFGKGSGYDYIYVFSVNGKEYKSWVNVLPKQSVEITSLSIIDKYKLYTIQSRIFKVEMIDYPVNNKLSDKTFTLMNDGIKIICKRSDFKTIDKINYKKLFTIQ